MGAHSRFRLPALLGFVAAAAASFVHCVGDDPPAVIVVDGGGPGGGSDGGPSGEGGGPSDAGGPPFDLDASCVSQTISTPRLPVYMELVVDFSGSMSDENKYEALKPALVDLFQDLGTQADPSIGVGLIVFSDSNDPTQGKGPYPSNVDVPIRLVDNAQMAALKARVQGVPSAATPTLPALQGAYPLLESFNPAAGALPPNGKKVVVLMTDGLPTEPPTPTQDQCIALANTALTKAAPQGPIQLFVVGVGAFPGGSSSYDPQFLGKLAVAGGTAKPNCNPLETADPNKLCYFQITPAAGTAQALGAKFTAAIDNIRSQAALCEFKIEAPQGTAVNPAQVNVVLYPGTGTPRVVYPFEASKNPNGWTFDNGTAPSKVILHGTACNDVKVDLKAKVGIVLGCETARQP